MIILIVVLGQVLGLTVRVLEALPLLLKPLAILTLRCFIIARVTMTTMKLMIGGDGDDNDDDDISGLGGTGQSQREKAYCR